MASFGWSNLGKNLTSVGNAGRYLYRGVREAARETGSRLGGYDYDLKHPMNPNYGQVQGASTTTAGGPSSLAAPVPGAPQTINQGLTDEQKAAQEAAQRRAKANAMKGGITGLVSSIKNVYDALYGDIDVAAREKTGKVNEQYNTDVSSLTNQFNEQFPAIGNAYSARGAYDSSYRQNKEGEAQRGYEEGVAALGKGRDEDIAGTGQWLAGQRATIGAERGGLDDIMNQILASENPDDLAKLEATLSERRRTLEASRAGYGTQQRYINELNSSVPNQDRFSGVKGTLTNVINSQVPGPVKRAIGAQIIQNLGLSPEETAAQIAAFNSQISGTDEEELA